jgi:hypothetical protein
MTARDPQTILIDEWRPLWSRECEICGQVPCVQGISYRFDVNNMRDASRDKVEYDGTMCGVCTWGEAACADPENW